MQLIRWEKAKQAIAECKTIDEGKVIRDKAEALRAYAKQAKESLQVQNDIAEIKLRAERRIGEFSRELPKNERARTDLSAPHDGKQTKTSILADAGIIHPERYEAIASLPEAEFEKHIVEVKASNEELTTVGIIRKARQLQKAEEVVNIAKNEPKEFSGLYDVIVIDPPWPMKKIERDCHANQVSSLDYPTMTEEELQNFKLPSSENCHIWLWTTHKFLPMAFRLLETWELKYVCCFTWHKPGGFQPYNLPQYNCEFALYARNGTPRFIDTKAFNVCFAAPRGKHSEKPEEFYNVIRRVTSGRRIDIFNRREIKGFDRYGNEV